MKDVPSHLSCLNRRLKHFCVFVLLCLSLAGCGKRGAPVPPREKVPQRVEIAGFQRGNQVILSWKMPARNAKKDSVLNISRADIYRLAEPVTAPVQLSDEEFANRSTLIAAVPITAADFGAKTINYKDTLEFAGQAARLRYAVRFVNASGQKAAFSNVLLIEPTSKVAGAPASLTAEASQEAIRLSWVKPDTNIDGSPANVLGYYVYRSPSEKEPAKLLNDTPVTTTEYDDRFFEFGKTYFYFVRAVSAGTQSEPIEGAESNILRFTAVDTFAPAPPSAITIAASPNTISIFWAVNLETDVSGYTVYRSEDRDAPLTQWTRLTPELLTTNTFQDTRVESGKTYYYYLTATDKYKNVSGPSEIVSETTP